VIAGAELVRRRVGLAALALATWTLASWPGEASAQRGRVPEEVRLQLDHLRENCGALKTAMSCATGLVTGRPMRIVFAGIAPGNGPAFGGSFGTSWAPNEQWRLSWSADGARTFGGSWRTGTYLTFVHTPDPVISVVTSPAAATPADLAAPRPSLSVNVYAFRSSTQDLSFFGLGASSVREAKSSFGMSQSVVGASVVAPLARSGRLNLALLGDVNARFVSLRDGSDEAVPATRTVFTDATAPGLTDQPRFLQFGGGARITPSIHRFLNLNYLASARRFVSSGGTNTFGQWSLDLDHDIGLFRRTGDPDPDPEATNDCVAKPSARACIGTSQNLGGTIHLRAFVVSTSAAEGAAVPFYFQPTIGGSDIRGQRTLLSFDNYRFRAPHALLFQQSFEHSIWGPIGGWVQADQGMVAMTRDQLGLGGLKKTITTGMTIRAGGAPALIVSYAMGGGERRRLVVSFNAAILGGATRPTLD
jgi:hypothetical protein